MERKFTEFRSVEAGGTTALMTVTNDGRSVLLSKDWASTAGDGIEAEWEPVVKALVSSEILDIGSLEDSVTIDSATAIDQIIDSDLVDTTDGRGNLRARALIEYLIESGVFEMTEDNLILLESFDSKVGEDNTSMLTTAAIFEYLSEHLSDVIAKAAEIDKDSEDIESDVFNQLMEDDIPLEPQEITEETAQIVDKLSVINEFFEHLEAEIRKQAVMHQIDLSEYSGVMTDVELEDAITDVELEEMSHDTFEDEMHELASDDELVSEDN